MYINLQQKYLFTCGFNLSGLPSSELPKKLRFVMQEVLKNSFKFPNETLVPLI